MNEIFLLLTANINTARNRLTSPDKGSRFKFLLVLFLALIFWSGIFGVTFKLLKYFNSVEDLGAALSYKLFSLIWLTGGAVLIFSCLISSLSSFYLSRDLDLIHSAPIKGESFFWSRAIVAITNSSWMAIIFGTPVFIAYGCFFKAGWLYYFLLFFSGLAFILLVSFLSLMVIIALVKLLPARRIRDVLVLLTLFGFIILYITFRFAQPEKLLNPDSFLTTVSYLMSLQTPSSYFLPSQWNTDILWPHIRTANSVASPLFMMLLLWSSALMAALSASFFAKKFYLDGYTKSQDGGARRFALSSLLNVLANFISKFFGKETRSLAEKDFKIFFRDSAQWTQLFLLAALILIYLFNFSALDLTKLPFNAKFVLGDLIAFANMALVALVTATLASRFAFSSISGEGQSFWIIRSSPLSLKKFLWFKFKFWLVPLLILSLFLTIVSNLLLKVSALMMVVSIVTSLITTPGVCALAIGLGAIYPQFENENIAQVSSSYGGLVFMLLASCFVGAVILLESLPAIVIIRSQMPGVTVSLFLKVGGFITFLLAIAASVLVVFLPLKRGLIALSGIQKLELL